MSETAEITIPDLIQEYLEPIPGDSPVGKDAANEEEFFKLNMEFPKTVPDYKNWIELSEIILKEKSKDIKVASWLCFAFYRTENLKGFKDGLILVLELLKRYGTGLYPENPQHKSKAIQFLNTSRVTKLIEREQITKSNADDINAIDELLKQIAAEGEKLIPDNPPVLQTLQDIITNHVESAKKASTPPPPPPEKKIAPPPAPRTEFKQTQSEGTEQSAPVKAAAPASEDEAVVQLRRTLTYFHEYISNGETKEKIPDSYFVYGIARQVQWGGLSLPSAEEKITNIEPPNDVIRRLVKEWFTDNKFEVLIPRIELEFIKDNSEFRYWLDAQRYLVTALERKGGSYTNAANDIKYYLSRLNKRLPELKTFFFSGGEIPFADKETINWLGELGTASAESSKSSESVSSTMLTPIVDASFDDIQSEYKQAVSNLPAKFQENFEMMQQKIRADDRIKGKFLRRLNLANYCYEAKHYNVAKVNLEELNTTIDKLNLGEWEPALSTAVWQSLYLTNVQLLFTTDNDSTKFTIEKQQEELYNNIAKYNGILAINLEQQKHKRRK
ncbi:MAG: type VI secretion system domain-containing protein [Ignavibacteriales bacterium]|nr:MAG: type VI secretion system domain-containing protein [Ignavibacteriales bacterium]